MVAGTERKMRAETHVPTSCGCGGLIMRNGSTYYVRAFLQLDY